MIDDGVSIYLALDNMFAKITFGRYYIITGFIGSSVYSAFPSPKSLPARRLHPPRCPAHVALYVSANTSFRRELLSDGALLAEGPANFVCRASNSTLLYAILVH